MTVNSILLSLSFILLSAVSLANTDTSWLDHKWKACDKNAATYFSTKTKRDSLWMLQLYYKSTNRLSMNGTFKEELCLTKTGTFTWYSSVSRLSDSIIYDNGKPVYLAHFHSNGKVKTLLLYNKSGATYVNSWDSLGEVSYCDTFYHDRAHNECNKDTAWLKGIIKKEDSLWHLQFFYVDAGGLYINSWYRERLCRTRAGTFTRYLDGKLNDSIVYNENGKKQAQWKFLNNCRLSSYRTYDSLGVATGGMNWDENGNERIFRPNVKYPAQPGGFKNWKKKLIVQLNNDKSIDPAVRNAAYGSLHVRLVIDKYGKLQAVYISDHCAFPEMEALIIRTIELYDQWQPGTIDNNPTDFKINCNLSFSGGKVSGEQETY